MEFQQQAMYPSQGNKQVDDYGFGGGLVWSYDDSFFTPAVPAFPMQAETGPFFGTSMHQGIPQEEVVIGSPYLTATSLPEQLPGAFPHQSNFQERPPVASEQPRKKLGRPVKPKLVHEGPKRGRGRPAGAKDTKARAKRGEKQAMCAEERRKHMANLREARKRNKANSSASTSSTSQARAEDWNRPQIPAPMVPQAPTEAQFHVSQQQAWQPPTSILEGSSDAIFGVGQQFAPQPPISLSSDAELDADLDFWAYSGPVAQEPQMAFSPYGQDVFLTEELYE